MSFRKLKLDISIVYRLLSTKYVVKTSYPLTPNMTRFLQMTIIIIVVIQVHVSELLSCYSRWKRVMTLLLLIRTSHPVNYRKYWTLILVFLDIFKCDTVILHTCVTAFITKIERISDTDRVNIETQLFLATCTFIIIVKLRDDDGTEQNFKLQIKRDISWNLFNNFSWFNVN